MKKKYSVINTLIYIIVLIYLPWEVYNILLHYALMEVVYEEIFDDFAYDVWPIIGLRFFVCLLMFLLCLILPRINKVIKYLLLVSLPFLCFMSFYMVEWGNRGSFRVDIEEIEREERYCYKDLGLPCGITIRSSCNPNDTTFYSYWNNICWDGYDSISREKLSGEIPKYCYVIYDELVTKFTQGKYFVVVSGVNGNKILLRRDFIDEIFGEDIYDEAIRSAYNKGDSVYYDSGDHYIKDIYDIHNDMAPAADSTVYDDIAPVDTVCA